MATLFPLPLAVGKEWCNLLSAWAVDGSLEVAARQAFKLESSPLALQALVSQWAEANFESLPAIELVSRNDLPGAAAAYGSNTTTIYLNQDWLATASTAQAIAVLTEELGHHLDSLLNLSDTPGDEGEFFARLLAGAAPSADQVAAVRTQSDHGQLIVAGQQVDIEYASLPQISVKATANGNEVDGSPVVFTFNRTGSTAEALKVGYQLFGTAQVGGDYTGSNVGEIVFSAGNDSAILSLPTINDILIIDPGETVLARIEPAASYLIVAGSQLATATITAEGINVTKRSPTRPGWSQGEVQNHNAFAVLKNDGSVVAWGDSAYGGTAPAGLGNVTQIFSNKGAFAALRSDGTVVAWGDSGKGGSAPADLSSVIKIFSNEHAFVALKSDGTIVAWGDPSFGATAPSGLGGVLDIVSNNYSFAALKTDGTVAAWGNNSYGGTTPTGLAAVTQIVPNEQAYAALKSDGTVLAWGNIAYGGTAPAGLNGVTKIFSTNRSFVALNKDGTVVAWGDSGYGGATPEGLSSVTQITSNDLAFAALKDDGTVVTWGNSTYGGSAPAGLSSVIQIVSNNLAFAALSSDGSVVAWGDSSNGGTAPTGLSDVRQIYSNDLSFAALKNDGTVIAWGSDIYGGTVPTDLSGVTQIFANDLSFAALKSDGTVVTWGGSGNGGNATEGLNGVVGFADPYTDDQLPAGIESLTPSASIINEGASLTTTVITRNLAAGTPVYYSLTGKGITTEDFSAGMLTGTAVVGADGSFGLLHTLANDIKTEGDETLELKIFTDPARSIQFGNAANILIKDASKGPAVIYKHGSNQPLLLKASIKDGTGFNALTIYFSNSGLDAEAPAIYADLNPGNNIISGSAKDGSFATSIAINPTTQTGTYQVSSLSISDKLGNLVLLSDAVEVKDYLASLGIDPTSLSFEVTGNPSVGGDVTPPSLSALSLSGQSVNLSSGNQFLLLNAAIKDASGLSNLQISFANQATNNTSPEIYASLNPQNNIISGTAKDGSYAASIAMNASTPNGNYQVASLWIRDTAGNQVDLDGKDALDYLSKIGINPATLSFQVIGTAPTSSDKSAPSLTSLTLSSKSVDISSSNQSLLLKASIKDATGLSNLSISFSNGLSDIYTSLNPNNNTIIGSAKDGSYAASILINQSKATGIYQVSSLSILDILGNQTRVDGTAAKDFLKSIGIDAASLSFEVKGSPLNSTDIKAPLLASLAINQAPINTETPKIVTITSAASLTSQYIDIDFIDSVGLGTPISQTLGSNSSSWGYLSLSGPDGETLTASIEAANLITGTSKVGTLRIPVPFDSQIAAGAWSLSRLELYNQTGLTKQVSGYNNSGDLATSLAQTAALLGVDQSSLSINIVNKNTVVSQAPLVKAIRFGSPTYDITSGNTSVSLEIDFSDSAGLGSTIASETGNRSSTWGYVGLTGPNGETIFAEIGSANLIAGTTKQGTLRLAGTLPANTAPGTWVISQLKLNNTVGLSKQVDSINYQGDQAGALAQVAALLGVSPSSLSVSLVNKNTSPAVAPTVNAIRFGASSYDVSAGTASASLDIDFTDSAGLGSSIANPENEANASWGLINLTGPNGESVSAKIGSSNLVAGTKKQGTLRLSGILSPHMAAGIWSISRLSLYNKAGLSKNVEAYSFQDDQPSQLAQLAALLGVNVASLSVNIVNSNSLQAGLPVVKAIRMGTVITNPSYTITPSLANVNEGSTLATSIATGNVASGTTLYWSVGGNGINAADFSSGSLTGSGIVGSDGKFIFSHALANDVVTEGDETLQIKLFSDLTRTLQLGSTAAVNVKDTSTSPLPAIKDTSGKEVAGASFESKKSLLSDLTASVPLKAEASKLLDRYKINNSASTTPKSAASTDSSFIDFTIKAGSLKSIIAEIALDQEIKANAYVKVNPNTGEAFDFTYDPITGLGAELLDTNKNGLVDSLRMHLQDGAKGDVDGLINGQIRDPGLLADAPRQSVYRFFKASKGVHLYSSSEEERAIVNANPEWGYKDEGVAYDALVTQGKALHRFFNAKASYHFMTTNDEEAKTVKANPAWGFSYEGESFSVSTISQLGMSTPVNRFYRVLDGVGQHFYTASSDEANNIIAHPEWGYKSEGVAWYV